VAVDNVINERISILPLGSCIYSGYEHGHTLAIDSS